MADVINCGVYDHFEIACMRRSQISLELNNGDIIDGVARDLIGKDGKEYLLIKVEDAECRVNLKDIEFLVLVDNDERITIF